MIQALLARQTCDVPLLLIGVTQEELASLLDGGAAMLRGAKFGVAVDVAVITGVSEADIYRTVATRFGRTNATVVCCAFHAEIAGARDATIAGDGQGPAHA